MQNSRLSHMRKFFFFLGTLLCLALLSGCEAVKLTDLTPSSYPDNPSRIYTITLRVATSGTSVTSGGVRPGSVQPYIIIDGQNHLMTTSPLGQGIYEYDYHLPNGREQLAYYFLVKYEIQYADSSESRETYTQINKINIASRYVLSLATNRGPVGARISILGRGFTPQDVVYFGSNAVQTSFDSPSSLSFFVPSLSAAQNYNVTIGNSAGQSPVGTFRIDPSSLSVLPSALNLRTGESQSLTFTIGNPAPAGGLLLDVTTDVPESIIMPEVVIPSGQTTVTITVQGGHPGTGNLYLKGYDAGEVTIPVAVSPN